MWKGEQARDEMVKDVYGRILRDGVELRRRLAEYFEQVLNVADDRKYQCSLQLVDAGVGRFEMKAISLEEVGEAVIEMYLYACLREYKYLLVSRIV